MIGDLAFSGEILGAGELVGKYGDDQILGRHARELRRHLLAAALAWQRQRRAGHPAPARGEHRRVEQGRDQDGAHAGGIQVMRCLAQLEAVGRGERQHDIVLGRRRLELEIELAAEALA